MSVPEGVFQGEWHEKDERWTAVDKYTISHLHPTSRDNHAVLQACLSHSHKSGLPDIATYPIFSKMLALQCRMGQVEHAIEVGTLGGYTPIWLTTMNPNLRVTAFEVSAKHARVARENLERAGVADRVNIIVGDAMKEMPKVVADVKAGKLLPVGLTYIDADKNNNWNYFDMAVQMSKPGAAIYVDNVVWRGKLATGKAEDEEEQMDIDGARLLVEHVGKDSRVDALVQQTVAEKSYDGYLMATVL